MDWNALYVLAGAALNALIIGIWKPWGTAHAGEKGKNFARKEDLDVILAEVRAVTITQKEIEHKLGTEFWHTQMQWNEKRDMYVRLIRATLDIQNVYSAFPFADAGDDDLLANPYLAPALKLLLTNLATKQPILYEVFAIAAIFGSRGCNDAISVYIASLTQDAGFTKTKLFTQSENLGILAGGLINAAKNDLHIRT